MGYRDIIYQNIVKGMKVLIDAKHSELNQDTLPLPSFQQAWKSRFSRVHATVNRYIGWLDGRSDGNT